MSKQPRVLIVNDDGIGAPGLYHLWKALQGRCDLTVCAPMTEQSGVGLAITVRQPLRVERAKWPVEADVWCVNGTPADCVKIALYALLKNPPDLIVSGINRGSNAGRNVLYSGTVGGVIEGAMRDIPGIAFSCESFFDPDYAATESFIPNIVTHILKEPLPKGSLLNVTFPKANQAQPKGIKLTRQGMEYWQDDPSERSHPLEGHNYYWLGAKAAQYDEHEDSDIAWLRRGYVTAVPLQVHDLTHHSLLGDRKKQFEMMSLQT